MKSVLKQAAVIILPAAFIGLLVNSSLLFRYVRGDFREGFFEAGELGSLIMIDLDRAIDLFDQGRAVFIDSRSAEDFAQGHIPRARNIPLGNPRREELLNRLGLEASTPLVVYCSGGACLDSLHLAQWISGRRFFKEVYVFSGGWEAWTGRGAPMETTDVQK